jgi:hypothetical protein
MRLGKTTALPFRLAAMPRAASLNKKAVRAMARFRINRPRIPVIPAKTGMTGFFFYLSLFAAPVMARSGA